MATYDLTYPVISSKTEFGMGWRWKGLHRLYGVGGSLDATDEKVLLVYDNFAHLVFTRNADGSYTSPKSDYSTLKALPGPLGGFTRKMKDGMTYVFNSEGFLLGKVDRYRRRTTYMYLPDGKLFQIIHDDGSYTAFSYSSLTGLIESITDPIGRMTEVTHDRQGNVVQITDADDSSRSFEYASNHALMTQVDKRGHSKSYAYDREGRVIQAVRSNSLIRLSSAATRMMEAVGGDGSLGSPTMASFTGGVRLSQFSDENGNTIDNETNEFGSTTRRTNALGGQTIYMRDDNNNIVEFFDEEGNTYFILYDDYGNITGRTAPSGRTLYEFNPNPDLNFHQPVAVIDFAGRRTELEYDSSGNITKVIDPEGHVTIMTYKAFYRLGSVRQIGSSSGIDYEYDEKGNQTKVIDIFGRVLRSRGYDRSGNVISETDALGNATTFTYDSLNRVITQVDAQNGELSFSYDRKGNLSSVNDQRGNTTSYFYDKRDLLIRRLDPLGVIDRFEYDNKSNLVFRVDKKGDSIFYEYDARNRMVKQTFSDGSYESYEYNRIGKLVSAQTPDSFIAFEYEANKIARVDTADAPPQNHFDPMVSVWYEYDKSENLSKLADSVTGVYRQAHFEYDHNDNLIKFGHFEDSGAHFIKIAYDEISRMKEVTYPNGIRSKALYVPGKGGQLAWLGNFNTHFQGTPMVDPVEISSFNYSYNLNDYITKVDASRGLLTMEDASQSPPLPPVLKSIVSYEYDSLNQLISATDPLVIGDESFEYDILGNRLRSGDETVDSTFNQMNQLVRDKKFSYVYGKNGNLIEKTVFRQGL